MATTTAKPGRPDEKVTQEDLQADIAQLKQDLAAIARQLAATGERSVNTARRAASDQVESLRLQGEATLADLRSGAQEMEVELVAAVREKPITSLAIAAGVGFIFALLTRR